MTGPTPFPCDDGNWAWLCEGSGANDFDVAKPEIESAAFDLLRDDGLGLMSGVVVYFRSRDEAIRAYDAAVKALKARCDDGD